MMGSIKGKLKNPITRMEEDGKECIVDVLGKIEGTKYLYIAQCKQENGDWKLQFESIFKEKYNILPFLKRTEKTLINIDLTKFYHELAGKIEKGNIEDMTPNEREAHYRRQIKNFPLF